MISYLETHNNLQAAIHIYRKCGYIQEFSDESVDGSDLKSILTAGINTPSAMNGEKKEEYKKLLQIPDDQSAVAVLLIGHAKNTADSVTGATERNLYDEVVSLIKCNSQIIRYRLKYAPPFSGACGIYQEVLLPTA